jgi:hypothetical protein
MAIKDFLQKKGIEFRAQINEHTAQFFDYSKDSKTLILKELAIKVLCNLAMKKYSEIKVAELDAEGKGFIFQISGKKASARYYFAPIKMIYNGKKLVFEMKLLERPEIEPDERFTSILLQFWMNFLGLEIPSFVLPEGFNIKGDVCSFSYSGDELKYFAKILEDVQTDVVINFHLDQSTLKIKSNVHLNFSNLIKEITKISVL